MESHNQIGHAQNQAQRTKTVLQPSRYDGIGNALRSAYDDAALSLPDDMKRLLARLS